MWSFLEIVVVSSDNVMYMLSPVYDFENREPGGRGQSKFE
jgi:hypothetical protein